MDLPAVDLLPHEAVAHVGPAPGHQVGPGQAAVQEISGRGAGEQVDLETLAGLGPPDQLPRNPLGVAGGEPGDEQVGAVMDVARGRFGIADPVAERPVLDSFSEHSLPPDRVLAAGRAQGNAIAALRSCLFQYSRYSPPGLFVAGIPCTCSIHWAAASRPSRKARAVSSLRRAGATAAASFTNSCSSAFRPVWNSRLRAGKSRSTERCSRSWHHQGWRGSKVSAASASFSGSPGLSSQMGLNRPVQGAAVPVAQAVIRPGCS